MSEEKKLEAWRREQFKRLGFNADQALLLTSWKASYHSAERFLNGGATHAQVMRLLYPV